MGAVLAVGLAALVACEPVPPTSVTLAGHGWGHGRGMSQFGAYGYAVDHGWSGAQILDRYYGGTVTSTTADSHQRVLLTAQSGRDLVVTNTLGQLRISADSYATPHPSYLIRRVGPSHFQVFSGSSCTGPWHQWSSVTPGTAVRVRAVASGNDPRAMVQLCRPGGTTYYRGDLLAVQGAGTIQTVNDVDIEDLVRSVIAREESASWADAGGGRGINALRAQAVAARSYAVAGDTRFVPWATTCDSTLCQAYGGYGNRATGSTQIVKVEDGRTDAATSSTHLQVRKFPVTGAVARTEFSSSSGGFTAGGTFPVARDDGDATSINPNHDWTVTLSHTVLEAAFDARQGHDVGAFEGLKVLKRNGYGDQGGRVLSLTVSFANGDVTLTGNDFRKLVGLKSDWFAPVVPPAPSTTP